MKTFEFMISELQKAGSKDELIRIKDTLLLSKSELESCELKPDFIKDNIKVVNYKLELVEKALKRL